MGTVASATRLGTSETPDAAGTPAQRAVARAPDGALWAVFPDAPGGSLQCLGSRDGGASWTPAAQSEVIDPAHDASLTMDVGGYRETRRLWAAKWGGSLGVVTTEATYYGGR